MSFICNICMSIDIFTPTGYSPNRKMCNKCKSFERHRALI